MEKLGKKILILFVFNFVFNILTRKLNLLRETIQLFHTSYSSSFPAKSHELHFDLQIAIDLFSSLARQPFAT